MFYTPPFQFRHWTCLVRIPGNTVGNPFFCNYLNVWILWLSAFIWSPAQWKSAWTDAGKLTEHFDTKYGWKEDDCGKKLPPKARSAWMPVQTIATAGTWVVWGSISQTDGSRKWWTLLHESFLTRKNKNLSAHSYNSWTGWVSEIGCC